MTLGLGLFCSPRALGFEIKRSPCTVLQPGVEEHQVAQLNPELATKKKKKKTWPVGQVELGMSLTL